MTSHSCDSNARGISTKAHRLKSRSSIYKAGEELRSRSNGSLQHGGAAAALESLLRLHQTVGFAVRPDGAIQYIYSPGAPLPDCVREAFVGHSMKSLLGPEVHPLLDRSFEAARQQHKMQEFGCRIDTCRGSRWFSVLVTCFAASLGSDHFSVLLHDTTTPRRIDTMLGQTDSLLALAEEIAEVGTWQVDLSTGDLTFSDHLYGALRVGPGEKVAVSQLVWNVAGSCYDASVGLGPEKGAPRVIEQEFSYTFPNRESQLLQARAIPLTSGPDTPLQFVGIIRDITERRRDEERLRRHEAVLAQAARIANLGSWELDAATGHVVSGEFRSLFDNSVSDPRTSSAPWEGLHSHDRGRVRDIVEAAIRECKEFEYIARCRLPNGKWRIHRTRGVPIRGSDGKAARLIGVVQDITDQVRIENELHALSRQLLRARDEERRQMARELHESAGQSLAALKMTLGNLRDALPKRNVLAASLLHTCFELTEEAVREVRTVSYLMHPPMLDEAGLASALRWYAKGFSERSKISVTVDAPEAFGRLPQEVELTLFRVIQEALTNVHRYSGSRDAFIRLTRDCENVRVEVQDTGCGIAQPSNGSGVQQPLGVGIAGMRERVHQLNGSFEIRTTPGRGTTVHVGLPVCGLASGHGLAFGRDEEDSD
ncbi:MAG TPA: ATP-binding protein [Candidatus Limnocylindrales bacterium]|nr:ATP-binding protein [Candidatus Limnocylindrales bacterium]